MIGLLTCDEQNTGQNSDWNSWKILNPYAYLTEERHMWILKKNLKSKTRQKSSSKTRQLPSFEKNASKIIIKKRVNCHRLKKMRQKSCKNELRQLPLKTKNASVIIPKNCVKSHVESDLRQKSSRVTVPLRQYSRVKGHASFFKSQNSRVKDHRVKDRLRQRSWTLSNDQLAIYCNSHTS